MTLFSLLLQMVTVGSLLSRVWTRATRRSSMTSTPRQPWKTTSNRSRTQEWRNKTSILLYCFYSNLDFMLKEILQIKTLIEDASKAMTLTYADSSKKLSFDF